MNHISFFNGISTTLYAAELAGWQNIAASELDEWCNRHLARWFRHVEQLGDITTADFTRFGALGNVVLSGGFPCQDISSLGKGEGVKGAKSGLWGHYRRAIEEIHPRFALIENSGRLNRRGLEQVLHELAQIGYDGEWTPLSASSFGAKHIRQRTWILAYPHIQRRRGILHMLAQESSANFRAMEERKKHAGLVDSRSHTFLQLSESYGEPPLFRDYDGLTKRLDPVNRLGGVGNAMYWPIPYAIFRWIDFAEKCTEAEWLQVNYDALISLETDNS